MAASGFVTIHNNGDQDDVLMGVEFGGAENSQIHQMEIKDGVMSMRSLDDGIIIKAGDTLIIKPGKIHLMFMGLGNQLKDGQILKVKLNFENAGEIEKDFSVLTIEKGRKLMMGTN